MSEERRTGSERGRLREQKTPRKKDYTEWETGAATEGRPYGAFHFSRVVPVPPSQISTEFLEMMSDER